MLVIEDLHVQIEGEPILKGLSLVIREGEIHAIMGPNGAGKSTLAKILAGHPAYEITKGTITFRGKNLLELEPHERVHLGLFLSFQYPVEIAGITNQEFLLQSLNAQRKANDLKPLSEEEFLELAHEKMKALQMNPAFLSRSVNEGFSGGEKKKNEILQMNVFDPVFSILDETDSGLDIDSMKIVASGINQYKSSNKALLLITHYQRLLDYVKPDFVHVLMDGKIVESGNYELAHKLEAQGYDFLMEKCELKG